MVWRNDKSCFHRHLCFLGSGLSNRCLISTTPVGDVRDSTQSEYSPPKKLRFSKKKHLQFSFKYAVYYDDGKIRRCYSSVGMDLRSWHRESR